MVAMGRGGGKTPARVIEVINSEVAKMGQNATARAMKLPLYSVQKYLAGIAEPSQATLEKIADYFQVEVDYLRGSGLYADNEMCLEAAQEVYSNIKACKKEMEMLRAEIADCNENIEAAEAKVRKLSVPLDQLVYLVGQKYPRLLIAFDMVKFEDKRMVLCALEWLLEEEKIKREYSEEIKKPDSE